MPNAHSLYQHCGEVVVPESVEEFALDCVRVAIMSTVRASRFWEAPEGSSMIVADEPPGASQNRLALVVDIVRDTDAVIVLTKLCFPKRDCTAYLLSD
jgi:hypothetical protein